MAWSPARATVGAQLRGTRRSGVEDNSSKVLRKCLGRGSERRTAFWKDGKVQ